MSGVILLRIMLKQRIFFGVLMLAAAVGLFVADGYLAHRAAGAPIDSWSARLSNGGLSTALILLLSQLAIHEFLRLARQAGHTPLSLWPRVTAAALVAMPWLESSGVFSRFCPVTASLTPSSHLLLLGFVVTIVLMVLRRKTEKALSDLAISVLVIAYLGWFSSFVVRLRCDFPGPGGAFWVMYFVAVTKFTDIGAFLVGRKIGKRKLIPTVSPGKSVEGLVGGSLLAVVISVALAQLAPTFAADWRPLSLAQVLVFGMVMAVIGQLGDLAVSLIKRDVGAKDSGRVVPSFGGYLDIVDSPLLSAPVAWWMLTSWQVLIL